MDITDDILKKVVEQANVDFKDALRVCWPAGVAQVGSNNIQIIFGGDSRRESNLNKLKGQITWEDIFDIIQDVRKTGKTNKVTNTDVLYLQKNYRQ